MSVYGMSATRGDWIDGGKINIASVTLTDGAGHTMPDRRGLFVVHAVMLHTGKVLWFCGHVEDGHYALKSYLFDYRSPAAQLVSHDFPLHNPALARGAALLHTPTAEDPTTPGDFHADLFCCHFVHAHDGRVIVVGGADPDYRAPTGGSSHGSVGEKYVYAFDPVARGGNGQWDVVSTGSNIARLTEGRWYPTAVLLGDGRIAVFSGRKAHADLTAAATWRDRIAASIDVLTPVGSGNYSVTAMGGALLSLPLLPLYPGLHLAPNGRIYYTHTTWGFEIDPPANTQSINIPPGTTSGSWTDHAGIHPAQPRREEAMSVLLPPAQDGKILLFGGCEAMADPSPGTLRTRNAPGARFNHIANSADPTSSEVLDTSGAAPAWSAGPTLRKGRINGHGVILPDKKVLIFGGHNLHKWNAVRSNQSLESELYDPATNTTTQMADLNHARMYHSAAVLLPNGTVLVAGGADPDPRGLNSRTVFEWQMHHPAPDNFNYPADWAGPRIIRFAPDGSFSNAIWFNRKDFEIFNPTYCYVGATLDNSPRPDLTAIKRDGAVITQATYGSTITIETPQAATIDAVALIRPGAATHHTDTEQRYVALEPITPVNATSLTVTLPTNRNLAPPGYYMLWIVAGGKPCKEAKFILLAEPPPARVINDPPLEPVCIVVTAAMGSRDAPEVRFLQVLRTELKAGGESGARFIAAVNGFYYAMSPRIAYAMGRHPHFRDAMRAVAVRPAVSLIRKAVQRARGHRTKLIAILSAMGLAGIALAPVLALLVTADTLRRMARNGVRGAR